VFKEEIGYIFSDDVNSFLFSCVFTVSNGCKFAVEWVDYALKIFSMRVKYDYIPTIAIS